MFLEIGDYQSIALEFPTDPVTLKVANNVYPSMCNALKSRLNFGLCEAIDTVLFGMVKVRSARGSEVLLSLLSSVKRCPTMLRYFLR